MSYTMTIEPEVMHKAQACALRRGVTVDALVRSYLVSLVRQETRGERISKRLDAFVQGLPKLPGRPYRFRRADAYDGELA